MPNPYKKGTPPKMSDMTVEKDVLPVLEKNKEKNFVQRILSPNPKLKLKNPDGSESSHSMAWGEDDAKAYVYPTVVQIPGRPKLARLPDRAAARYAAKTGERIEVEHPEQADYLSQNYKKVWTLKDKVKGKSK